MDRCVLTLVDRKRWTGGRSRTLAPPRGAAWMSQSLFTSHRGVEQEMNQMLGTHMKSKSRSSRF
jgi:hypothetical protein